MNERYPPECITWGGLVDPLQSRFRVEGFQARHKTPAVISPHIAEVIEKSVEEKSANNHGERSEPTPRTITGTNGLHIEEKASQGLLHNMAEDEGRDFQLREILSDELDEAIGEMRLVADLVSLPLDDKVVF